jgi:hypothetical protein
LRRTSAYAVAQRAMGVEITYTCDTPKCGNRYDIL